MNNNNNQLALFGDNNQPAAILGNGVLVQSESKKDGKVTGRSAHVIKRSGSGITLASILGLSPKTDKAALDAKYDEAMKAFKAMQTVEVARIATDDSFTGGSVRSTKNAITFTFKRKVAVEKPQDVDKAIAKMVEAGLTPEQILEKVQAAVAAKNQAINVDSTVSTPKDEGDKHDVNTFGVTPEHIKKANEAGDPVDLSKFSDDDLTAMIKLAATNPEAKAADDIEVLVFMQIEEKLGLATKPE